MRIRFPWVKRVSSVRQGEGSVNKDEVLWCDWRFLQMKMGNSVVWTKRHGESRLNRVKIYLCETKEIISINTQQ